MKKNSYYIKTISYIFHIPTNHTRMHPRIRFLTLSQAAQDIYKLLRDNINQRHSNRQDAIDFIEVIRQELLDCGANHVYFGYIEDNGQVLEYEQYPL